MSKLDMREHLKKLEAIGQLTTLDNVPLEHAVGGVIDQNSLRSGGSILFDNFEGYEPGYRVLAGSMNNTKTMAAVLGFDGEYTKLELADAFADKIKELETKAKDYPIEYVEDGPIFENCFQDDDVDLYKIPVPIFHEGDGGPYIGTGDFQVHQDPETGWINCGTYRSMQIGKNRVGNFIAVGHHGDIIRKKYWDKGEPCPVAFVCGAHPLFYLMGSIDVPLGVDEYSWAGALYDERVQVVKLPKTGLPVPANAEIVLEGFAYPDNQCLEGPFGEFTGYFGGGRREQYYVDITGMYFRNDPVLLVSPPGPLPNDMSFQFALMRAANVKAALVRAGVPGVKAVWCPESSDGRAILITSIKQQFPGHASMAAHIAGQCPQGGLINKISIVVDDDIDPTNMDQVIWAVSTRCEPTTDIDITRESWSTPLEPQLAAEEKAAGRTSAGKMVIRATKPFWRLPGGKDTKNPYPKEVKGSPELTAKVMEQYGHIWGE